MSCFAGVEVILSICIAYWCRKSTQLAETDLDSAGTGGQEWLHTGDERFVRSHQERDGERGKETSANGVPGIPVAES